MLLSCDVNLRVLMFINTGKNQLELETPSGDADVSAPATLGRIHRVVVLLIG